MSNTDTGKSGKKLLFGIAAAVIVVIVLYFALFSTRKLNLTDYITAAGDGVSGRGTVVLALDAEKLIADIEAKKKLTDDQKSDITSLTADVASYCTVSPDSGLTNGDTVTIETNIDAKVLKAYRITLNNGSITWTAQGLIEPQTINLNEFIYVSYRGTDGYGEE